MAERITNAPSPLSADGVDGHLCGKAEGGRRRRIAQDDLGAVHDAGFDMHGSFPFCTHRAVVLSVARNAPVADGRSPGSRVLGLLRLPGLLASGMLQDASPLTVAWAATDLAPLGSSAPCSLFSRGGLSRPQHHQ